MERKSWYLNVNQYVESPKRVEALSAEWQGLADAANAAIRTAGITYWEERFTFAPEIAAEAAIGEEPFKYGKVSMVLSVGAIPYTSPSYTTHE